MKAFYCSSIAALVLLSGCAGKSAKPDAEPVPPGVLALSAPAKGDPAQRLTALLASEWQRWLVDHPEEASLTGDHRYDDRWTDMSLDAIEARHLADAGALLKLLEIDRERLTPAAQLNFDLYRQQLERDIEAYRYRGHLQPINHLGGVQTSDQLAEALQFETVLDYENWIRRIRGIDAAVDQSIVLLRMGLAEGRTVPKVIMKRVPPQIDRQLVKKPEASPLYTPFLKFAASVPEDQRARLADAAKAAIRDSALPAWQRLKDVVAKEYLPKCRDSVGASELPEGRDAYAFAARTSTTTNLTPDEIHDIGQREVTRIRGEMEAIRKQVGYQGNLKAFFTYLRTDPKFFYRDGATLLSAYRDIAKRIDPELPKLFGKLPRLPYGVRAVPEASAPDTHTAYYQPGAADGTRAGNFYANLYKPGSRPKWEQEALTAHEAVPGHHLQISLQQELVSDAGGTLPAFRSQISFTAFVEGWGLYAESLGPEIGLYKDPYSKFGQLTYEMWRAVRLVVDTGMHAKGWSRQQAIDFFKANTPRAELDITNEIDRYIAWPGQALAYKIGELKIKELRARATAALGSKFDIRGFHDVVLGSGAVPLDILERNVDAWIEQQDGGVIVRLRGTP
ncbi:DUF885 family protein [Nevskia sp.]|uniref:DUF885 domain-containing protein n=1 Tax=Nevskia sp. TaxID=1929292 RepID=UPI0025D1E638|nr:DUF885 domain-containing protein [Nevskia sp.]